MRLRKLIVLGESNNFFDEVRRIKSKMDLPETMGAGAARFEFDTDGHLDIFLITTGSSAVTWRMSLTKEKGSIVLNEASEDRIGACDGHFVLVRQSVFVV